MASRTWRRAWRGGDSSSADVALSCWYLYSDAVMSLSTVWRTEALKALWHSVGLMPAKAVLVMLHGFLEGLGSTAVPLTVVGIWWSRAWRVGCGICWGMSVAGMLVDHLACLLARRSKPYAAELKVGRVTVNE
jgi:hypothetical protein